MATAIRDETSQAIQLLETLFAGVPMETMSIRLWDGTCWPDARPRPATLRLKHPDALAAMFGEGTELGLAEAFLRDDFDVAGNLEAAIEACDALHETGAGRWTDAVARFYQLRRLRAKLDTQHLRSWQSLGAPRSPTHSQARDRQAIAFHYDLSNDFYRLWLDSRLLYSCAYFERPEDDIETAQTAKLHLLCRKLRLQPGQRLLDVGCGWGAFCLYSSQRYGTQATGITLSAQQAGYAASRVREAGLAADVTIELRDYREIEGEERFDAIVSIGMSEHVGGERLPEYFKKLASLLTPGGVLLNQAISDGVRPRGNRGPSFIEKYVFPDSDIPPVAEVIAAAQSAGLEVRDIENLREHYLLTLREWVRRLEAHHEAARMIVDEPTYRIWRLYMAASAHGFARGHLAVYQALFSKPDAHGKAHLPLTRRTWYS